MLAHPPSPSSSHATPKQSRNSTTRTVAHRRVYGKRRNNAPRAVFEEKSPAKQTQLSSKHADDAVEAIQTKLAEVTIAEEPVCPPDGDTQQPSRKPGEQDVTPQPERSNSPPNLTSPQRRNTPNKRSPSRASPIKATRYETLLEVSIRPKQVLSAQAKTHHEEGVPTTEKRSQRKKVPTARRSSGFVHDSKANAYVRPILDEALSPIASQSVQKFTSWASRSATMFHVAKLAEGSYGEVYKLHLREESCRPAVSKSKLAKLRAYGDGVFKVVPLRAQSGPGSKKFTSIEEIVSEVKMLKYLDPIPGFARFREIHVVQGRFPEAFQGAWDHYKKTKDDCMNPNPSSKKAYPDTQLWAIVEMDDAGCELEKFSWSSIFQIYDIFWGVAMALARAEEYAFFEVGDLAATHRRKSTDNSAAPRSSSG